MHLTPPGVVRYLLDRRYLNPEFVVAGDLRVSEALARNRGFRVTFGPERGYWVKQIREWTDAGIASFRREARWYWLVRNDDRFTCFRDVVPQCLAYDPENEILVMSLVDGPKHAHAHEPWLSSTHAAQLGRTIARFQRNSGDHVTDAGFSTDVPWALTLSDAMLDGDTPAARRELVRILGSYSGFAPALNALQEAWRPTALIHGDMKFENCIAAPDQVKIIDWEMAGFGDPLWDAAGILQAYWEVWVRERAPFEEVRAASGEFWIAYVDELAPEGDRSEALHVTLRYAAARLLQSVWEDRRYSEKLDEVNLKLLQLSLNIFGDAAPAARELVGV